MITLDVIDQVVYESQDVCVDDPFLEGLRCACPHYMRTRFNYYTFLYKLVQKRKPCIALEIGVELGMASAYMCAAALAHDGRVIGIDFNWHDIPGNQLRDIYGNYHFVYHDSNDAYDIVSKIVGVHGRIGVVFQDSSHHYAASVEEWKLYSQLLDENAIWVCDDISHVFYEEGVDEKSMLGYWDELPGQKKLYLDVLHYGNTVGVMII